MPKNNKRETNFISENSPTIETGFTPVAVVELFTSEGCSSCPPADKVFSEIPSLIENENVFLLAYHVHYWNRLGWEDRFSDAAYSERQKNYCEKLVSTVYTPQMIVGGTNPFNGSDKEKAVNSIQRDLQKNAAINIESNIKINADNSVLVEYKLLGELKDQIINAALIEKENESDVTKGENDGRILKHTNIVREFISERIKEDSGTFILQIPNDVLLNNFRIYLFTQDVNSGAVSGACSAGDL